MTSGAKKKVTKNVSIMSIVLVLVIAVSIVANTFSVYADMWLGRGKQTVVSAGDLDGNYIDFKATTNEEARDNAAAITLKTAEEGMILLKNDNNALPVAASTKLTILGYKAWHNNMSGGEDPSTTANAVSLGAGLQAGFTTNSAVNELYANTSGDFADPETTFASVKNTFAEYNTAVIVIARNSGEGSDQVRTSNDNGVTRNGLTLTTAEYKLIDYASKNFSSVIIVINAANTMELGFLDPKDPNYNGTKYTDPYSGNTYDFSGIKAAIWAGCCGSQGGTALAEIIKGDVNPSGHTPDIYVRDLSKDPSYQNFGNYEYTNARDYNTYLGASAYFVEYEEGIYIGYRYYETAAYEASKGNYAGFDYNTQVVYPFGYGLSYTTFTMEYDGTPSYDKKTDEYTFKVKVTNTGSVAGKAVAQIYVSAPYEKGMVEKAHVQLAAFGKTQLLQPGKSETLTITAKTDYFNSYDYITEKAYVLDKGDYTFYLSENSHSWTSIDKADATKAWTWTNASKIVYSGDNKRTTDLVAATNALDEETNYKFQPWTDGAVAGDGYIHTMTRDNFAASFATAPTGKDLILSDERTIKQIEVYDVWADEENPITEMPATNVDKTSYTLADMRGVDIDDEKWDDYIDQFTVESMSKMFSNGGWNELADADNGVPISYDADSPYGFYAGMLKISQYPHNIWYCGAPMVAATYNLEIATELGYAFAEEAWLFKQEDGQPVTGLYGYGTNTHRSAFGGRNYEYYSEDPVLAGKFAATEASSASEKGLITFMKHYVLNEQETNRQANGYCAWVDEQAFREIYNRSFEIYMKEAEMTINYYEADEETGEYTMVSKTMPAATGIMTSYNRVGGRYAGASNAINQILRNEVGFVGTVLTDAGGEPNTYMTTDMALRRGQNLTLTNNGTNGLYDTESATAVYWLKSSTRYLLYNKANSNAIMGMAPGDAIVYGISPWRIVLYIIWGLTALGLGFGIFRTVQVATGKVEVKEKVKKNDEDDDV